MLCLPYKSSRSSLLGAAAYSTSGRISTCRSVSQEAASGAVKMQSRVWLTSTHTWSQCAHAAWLVDIGPRMGPEMGSRIRNSSVPCHALYWKSVASLVCTTSAARCEAPVAKGLVCGQLRVSRISASLKLPFLREWAHW